ncbi:delta-aminolevulinic acid dehydratase, partial [Plakobranchus ocellatus]
DDPDAVQPINSMPGQSRYGVNRLVEALTPLVDMGLKAVLLFGVPENLTKDENGSAADAPDTPVIRAIQVLRLNFPSLLVCCDVCLCPYSSHGHCGYLRPDGTIDNEPSIERLAEISVSYARAVLLKRGEKRAPTNQGTINLSQPFPKKLKQHPLPALKEPDNQSDPNKKPAPANHHAIAASTEQTGQAVTKKQSLIAGFFKWL